MHRPAIWIQCWGSRIGTSDFVPKYGVENAQGREEWTGIEDEKNEQDSAEARAQEEAQRNEEKTEDNGKYQ